MMANIFSHDQIKRIANMLDGIAQVLSGSLILDGFFFEDNTKVLSKVAIVIIDILVIWFALRLERISQTKLKVI